MSVHHIMKSGDAYSSYLSELFGPILLIIPVRDVDEAIAIINERYVASLESPSGG